MSTDKLPEAVREQMEKTADALLWDSVPLCDETVQEILCEFALVCLKAAAQQERVRLVAVGHRTDMDPAATIHAAFLLANYLTDDTLEPIRIEYGESILTRIQQWRDLILLASHPPPTPEDR